MQEQYDHEIDELYETHAEEMKSTVDEYSQIISAIETGIEDRKEILMELDDKELMAEIMISISKIDARIVNIVDNEVLDGFLRQTIDVSSSIIDALNDIYNQVDYLINNGVDSALKDSIDQANNSLYNLQCAVDSLDRSSGSNDYNRIVDDLDEIKTSIGDVYSYNSIFSNLDDIKRSLSDLETEINQIQK